MTVHHIGRPVIYVYIHLIPYIPEVQIVHNRSPETTNYITWPLLKIFWVKFNFPSLIAENFRVAGIHISSRQVVRDDYKVLQTSIKITNSSSGRVSFKEQFFF